MVDFKPVKLQPNSMLFLNQDVVQHFDSSGNFDGKVILFTDSFFSKTKADVNFLKSSILFYDFLSVSKIQLTQTNNIFSELLNQMKQELSNENDPYLPDIIRNYLRSFLLHAERLRRKQDFIEVEKGELLDQFLLFKDLLEGQFRKVKAVSNYAAQLYITEKRLNKATSMVLGKTPKQVIDDRVMLEAKRLLAHSTDSVKQIGFILGFEEPTNFIKYFRKHQGATPIEFRESLIL